MPKPQVTVAERLPCPDGPPGVGVYQLGLETTIEAEASGWEAPWDDEAKVRREVCSRAEQRARQRAERALDHAAAQVRCTEPCHPRPGPKTVTVEKRTPDRTGLGLYRITCRVHVKGTMTVECRR